MKYHEIMQRAKAKLQEAKSLLEGDAPDMTAVKALQDEAAGLKTQAESLKALDADLAAFAAPVRPDLPMPGAPPSSQPPEVKAAYQIRYGDENDAIKAILHDLHGPDYEAKRLRQLKTFNRWLRDINNASIPAEGREFLWTPETVKAALLEGQDVAAMKTVMIESQDTLGGYAVPPDYQANVVGRLAALVAIRPVATKLTTSRDMVEVPTSTGGDSQYSSAIRGTMVSETPTAGTAATNLTLGMVKIPVHMQMQEVFLSRNLVEDAAFNLADFLARKMAESAAILEDNQFVTGDGNGRPLGLLPSSANGNSISEVVSGNASLLTYDGIIALTYGIDSQYRNMPTCRFLAEKATYKAVAQLSDGNARYYWDRAERQAGKLEGYQVMEQEAMPTITTNAFPLLFGDFSGYYIVDRVGMSIERYLDSATARINQVCYVLRRRYGGALVEPYRLALQKCST